jgi:hypothetical protein
MLAAATTVSLSSLHDCAIKWQHALKFGDMAWWAASAANKDSIGLVSRSGTHSKAYPIEDRSQAPKAKHRKGSHV